ncbi:hypothetical protein LLEC1_05894 [Akanthomyces lecanii]|uniref:DUF3669 domain-containing protein n=1 Tax=Cordyceps confragosa TaxID=2714763 RepID=A0A179ICN2_CORDF|nr:hypothetical protein LLEC1_05894 [Akanthomyces lecanii]
MEDFLRSSERLEKIGQGFCGTVWSEEGGALVVKRADGGPGRSLLNENHIYTYILSAVANYRAGTIHCENIEASKDEGNQEEQRKRETCPRIKVNIPIHIAFLEQTSAVWPDILPRLPEGFTACEASISERIPPMPAPVRELLASRYCPSPQQAAQMARDKANASCLVRPYLGRRRPAADQRGAPRRRFFSLRNFPLHADQMEELGLPVDDYAAAMADALAFLHWIARVDAGDVEYVLAPPRAADADGACIGEARLFAEALGQHGINDPFYPRPGAREEKDQKTWEAFEERFLRISGDMLRAEGEDVRALPGILMRTIRENRDTWTKSAIN